MNKQDIELVFKMLGAIASLKMEKEFNNYIFDRDFYPNIQIGYFYLKDKPNTKYGLDFNIFKGIDINNRYNLEKIFSDEFSIIDIDLDENWREKIEKRYSQYDKYLNDNILKTSKIITEVREYLGELEEL